MTEISIKLDYDELKNNITHISEDDEEIRLDELDQKFEQIIKLRDQEDLLLGFPVTKYDTEKKNYYVLYPNGDKVYG
jgi:hypothetical protein